MTLQDPFIVFALLMVVVNVATTIIIMVELDKRNIRTNILLARFLIFRYLEQYKRVTREETGKIGPLFYVWLGSINLAALSAIIVAITKA